MLFLIDVAVHNDDYTDADDDDDDSGILIILLHHIVGEAR